MVSNPKGSEGYHILVVFGDGSRDREFVTRALKNRREKHCKLKVFVPESGAKGIGELQILGKGVEGVLGFLKLHVTRRSPWAYIVVIDKEHCKGNCVNAVEAGSRKLGIAVKGVEKLNDCPDLYRFVLSVGSKEFRAYFAFLGKECCLEEFVLTLCNERVTGKGEGGEGCCKFYKASLRKLSKERVEACEESAREEFYKALSKAFAEASSGLGIN